MFPRSFVVIRFSVAADTWMNFRRINGDGNLYLISCVVDVIAGFSVCLMQKGRASQRGREER